MKRRKLLALLLMVVMMFTMAPMTASAAPSSSIHDYGTFDISPSNEDLKTPSPLNVEVYLDGKLVAEEMYEVLFLTTKVNYTPNSNYEFVSEDVINGGIGTFWDDRVIYGNGEFWTVTTWVINLECKHDYKLVSETATCTDPGVKNYKCSICDKTRTENMAALGHDWANAKWTKVDKDKHQRKCQREGCDYKETAAHTWDEGEVTTQATCMADGEKTYTCGDCRATKTETVPKLGHDWEGATWTKVDEDKHQRGCQREGCDYKETAAHTWDEGEVTTQATCTTDGEKIYTCGDCGATKTETIDKLGHDWEGATWTKVDEDKHQRKCQREGCDYKETAAHTWDEGEVTTQATCMADGEKTYTCGDCGAIKTETIDKLGHDWEGATWTKVDEDKHQRGCQREGCDYKETAAHTWDEGEVTTQATCTTDGEKIYTCGDCGATKTETIDKLGHDWEGATWTKVDEDKHQRECQREGCDYTETAAHTWDEGVVTTQATCIEDGVKTYTCGDCGAIKTETIDKLGHDWEGATWTKVDEDKHQRECQREGCDYTETAAHTWDEGVVTKEATTTEKGEKTFKCEVCGATKIEEIPMIVKPSENNPTDNSNANSSANTEAANADDAAKTGDNSNALIWALLAALSGTGIIVATRRKRVTK